MTLDETRLTRQREAVVTTGLAVPYDHLCATEGHVARCVRDILGAVALYLQETGYRP